MSRRWLPIIIVISLFGLASLVPVEVKTKVLAPQDEESKYFFGNNRAVGQEFKPEAGLTKIKIPVGSKEETLGPLLLHLRKEFFGPDIRQATVFEATAGEIEFSFRRLINPPDKLVWVLEAPHSPGHSHFVFREKDDSAYKGGRALFQNLPVVGNFSFSTIDKKIVVKKVQEDFWTGHQTWEVYSLLFGFTVALVVMFLTKKRILVDKKYLLPVIIFISVVLHLMFAQSLPVINDEGSYIQDVTQGSASFLPLKDYLTKGPVFLMVLKIWHAITPASFVIWRGVSIISWVVVLILFNSIAKQLSLPDRVRLLAVALLGLIPAVTSLTTPILLQPVAVAFVLGSVYLLLLGTKRDNHKLIIAAALVLLVAYLTRASSITILPVLLLIIYFGSRRLYYGKVFVLSLTTFVLLAVMLMAQLIGVNKTAVFFNAEALIISNERSEVAIEESDPVVRVAVRNAQSLWRSAPILLFSITFLMAALSTRKKTINTLLISTASFLLMFAAFVHLQDMNYLLPSALPLTRVIIIILVFAAPLLYFLLKISGKSDQETELDKDEVKLLLILVVWLVSLAVLYGKWGNFRQSYLVEFFVPLALLSSWAIMKFYDYFLKQGSKVAFGIKYISIFLIASSFWQGSVIAEKWPATGSMTLEGLDEVASVVKENSGVSEEIFTAQSAVTAIADRPIFFGYAHPGWYLYEKRGTLPTSLRELYFIEPEQVTSYLRDQARVVVTDRRTNQVYFDFYSERQEILKNDFNLIAEIESGASDPYRVYVRGE